MTTDAATEHAHPHRNHWATRRIASVFLAVAVALPWPAWAADAGEHPFSGGHIRMVVGFSVGGGYDAYARLLAPHLERETGSTVTVENWTGGGGIVALNRLDADRSDRLTVMLVNGPSATLAQLLGREGVRYDLRKMAWLGRVLAEKNVVLAGPRSSFRSLADILNAVEPVNWASPSVSTNAGIAALISQALNLDSRIIVGYKGSSESSLAVLRGEADLVAMSETSALKQAHGNGLIPVAVVGDSRSALLPEVPTVREQVELAPAGAWWIDYGSAAMQIGRALATSGRVSAESARYLRRVFEIILTDPEVMREAAARGRTIDFAPADVVRSHIESVLNGPGETARIELKHVITEKFLP